MMEHGRGDGAWPICCGEPREESAEMLATWGPNNNRQTALVFIHLEVQCAGLA